MEESGCDQAGVGPVEMDSKRNFPSWSRKSLLSGLFMLAGRTVHLSRRIVALLQVEGGECEGELGLEVKTKVKAKAGTARGRWTSLSLTLLHFPPSSYTTLSTLLNTFNYTTYH